MAKQSKQSGADDLMSELDKMANRLKDEMDSLVLSNKAIDAQAVLDKEPNEAAIRKLNSAYMRLTGRSHIRDEQAGFKGEKPEGRRRRSSALMQELAGQVHKAIEDSKAGLTGPEIRKAVAGLEDTDNISLLLKKYKFKFTTSGPRQSMKYLPV